MARIGIIGIGRMGERTAIAARGLGHEVARVLDSNADAWGFREGAFRDVATADADAFFATDLDLVAIATNAPSHVPLATRAIAAGHRRLLIEKPLCVSYAEGEALQAAADASDTRVVVNHGRRYCAVYDEIARLDGSPQMGPLRAATLTLGAAGLACIGTHYFDLFARVLGPATEAFAVISAPAAPNPRGAGFDDPGATAIVRHGTRRALIEMSDDLGIPPRLEFLYARGRLVIESEAGPWRVLARPADRRDAPLTQYGVPLEETALPVEQPCDILYATSGAIADALADTPPVAGLDVGLAAFAVFAALRHAAATGAPVPLPLPDAAKTAVYDVS